MASSSTPGDRKSVGYGQDHVKVQCDLCNTENDVTSHCTECVKNMCIICKQFHDNLHIDHTIITVFEGRIIQHLNTKCQTHDLLFSYHCENCQINICNKCRKTTHRKCNIIDIVKHADMLKTPFTKRVDKQIKHLPEIDKRSYIIKDHLTNFDRITENQISLIKTETEKRHNDLDVHKSNLIKQLKSEQTFAHKTLQDQIQTLQDLRTSIDNITTSIKTQLNLVSDAGILQLVNEGNVKLDSASMKKTFDLPNPSTFIPSTPRDKVNNPLGSLRNPDSTMFTIDTRIDPHNTSKDLPDTQFPFPTPSSNEKTPPAPSPSLRHEIAVVRKLSLGRDIYSCTAEGSTCWVGLSACTVQRYNQCGDQLLSVRLSHNTDYTAVTTTGELLVSGKKIISRVNKTGQVRTFTDISARGVKCVTGLVTTRQDDVFVCVEMNDKIKDKVLKFSAIGKKISELNPHFFTSTTLWGIHAVSRDTFCVQDGERSGGGRLVFVDGGGQLVRHIDHTAIGLQRDINSLAGDRHGHLIIATDDEYIHVLSGEGTCKRTYHIQGSGTVWGVSVGEDDVLWIWTGTHALTGNLIVAKYLE